MANTYRLLIDNLYVQPLQTPEVEVELPMVITKVDYHYEATSEQGTIVRHKDSKEMQAPDIDNFTKYEDVTYEDVQDWVRHDQVSELELYEILDNRISEIEKQKYVKVEKTPWELAILNIPSEEEE